MSSFIVVKNGLTLFLVVFGLFIIRNFDFFFFHFFYRMCGLRKRWLMVNKLKITGRLPKRLITPEIRPLIRALSLFTTGQK